MNNIKKSEQYLKKSHTSQIGDIRAKFGDVAKKINNVVDRENCGVDKFVAGEHMQTDNFRIKEWGTIGDGYLGPAFNHKFIAGQILYGSRRTYLRKISIPHFDGVCANTTFVIEPTGNYLLPELVPFLMQSSPFTEHSIRMSRGSTNPYVNWKDIACFEFNIPEIEIQRKIAELLMAAEECIIKNEEFVEESEKASKILMKELFSKGINQSEFKEEKRVGIIPKSWNVYYLRDLIIEPIKNGAFIQKNDSELSIPFLNVVDVYKSPTVKVSDLQKINCSLSDIENYRIQENDLIYVRSSLRRIGIAQCCLIPPLSENIIFDCHLMRVRIDLKKYDPNYLLYYSICDQGRNQLLNLSKTTTMSTIDQKDLGSFMIPFPSLSEQREIANILTYCDNTVKLAKSNLIAAISLKMKLINSFFRVDN